MGRASLRARPCGLAERKEHWSDRTGERRFWRAAARWFDVRLYEAFAVKVALIRIP